MASIFTDPQKIVFETDMDIVAYISGGTMCPTRKQFDDLMDALRNPPPLIRVDSEEGEEMQMVPKPMPITIEFDAIPDPDLLEKYMREVYKNRRRNDQMHFITGVALTALALNIGMRLGKHSAEKEYKNGSHHISGLPSRFDGDIPKV